MHVHKYSTPPGDPLSILNVRIIVMFFFVILKIQGYTISNIESKIV